jgi:hypothetical protein
VTSVYTVRVLYIILYWTLPFYTDVRMMLFGLNIIYYGGPLEYYGGPLEIRGSVAVRGSWLLLYVLQLMSLRPFKAGFALAGAKLVSCACVWIVAVAAI